MTLPVQRDPNGNNLRPMRILHRRPMSQRLLKPREARPHTRWHSFCSNCRHRCDKCKLRSPFPSKGSAAGAKRSDRLEKKSTNVHQPWVDDDPWICPACMSKISAQYDKCPMCNRGFKL
ncbi:hypothetical protein BU26DRAFT_164666 [Trematosphaeria pertusa]|uniref:Uncharacterized protein n=1 Tax=Trematosphaeria pertusa TaxID=390896 RepID=A0A6A6HVY7_9PLEO|nr:uncharacterized protein BU26DRAFT_164666 [Trematosphaeria pertusa]KAF2242069.1 hypothetical protein BU26DRAFT_164666 [Trematosphaeria pertusa]